MSSNNKMKGLLKGLRYISQIFENEKEPEMQIGFPTDVKHVAHIGLDGASANCPSWMNEFKASDNGGHNKEDGSTKSEDSSSRRNARDLELPKSSRHQASTGSSAEEPTKERSEKSRSRKSKQSNKDLSESSGSKNATEKGGGGGGGGEIAKKSRRKKSKDYSGDGSSRSSRTSRRGSASKSDTGSECGSVSKSNNNNNNEGSETLGVSPSKGGQEKAYTRFS